MPSSSYNIWDKHGAVCFFSPPTRQFLIAEEASKISGGEAPQSQRDITARLCLFIAAGVFVQVLLFALTHHRPITRLVAVCVWFFFFNTSAARIWALLHIAYEGVCSHK